MNIIIIIIIMIILHKNRYRCYTHTQKERQREREYIDYLSQAKRYWKKKILWKICILYCRLIK